MPEPEAVVMQNDHQDILRPSDRKFHCNVFNQAINAAEDE
jgi:hypothetical protein